MQWPRLSVSRSARSKKNMWGIILIIILIMLNKLVVSSFIQCLQYKCYYFHTHHPSPQVRTIIIGTFKQRSSKMLWQLVSSKVLLQIYISIPIPSFLFLFLFLQGASTRKPHCLLEILARLAQGETLVLHVLEIWCAPIFVSCTDLHQWFSAIYIEQLLGTDISTSDYWCLFAEQQCHIIT